MLSQANVLTLDAQLSSDGTELLQQITPTNSSAVTAGFTVSAIPNLHPFSHRLYLRQDAGCPEGIAQLRGPLQCHTPVDVVHVLRRAVFSASWCLPRCH